MRKITAVIIFGIIFLLSGCQSETPNQVIIGFLGALTGQDATFGISSKKAITMAVEEINQSGGLLGKPVELKIYDTQASAEEARLSVEKIIKSDHAVAILGEMGSTHALAGAPVAQKYEVPMITPSSTNPEVTKIGNYIFRVCFIDPFQAEVMARFAIKSLKLKRAAILHDSLSDYSTGLTNYFIKTFTALGGQVTANENYVGGDVDFLPQLQRIALTKPDFILIPGYYSEVGIIARQAREIGIKVPFLGGDGWDSESLIEIAGRSLEGSYFSNHYTHEDPRPEVQSFIQRYEKKFGTKPDSHAASGYDAAWILFEAIKTAKSIEPKKVRDALSKVKEFKGVTGMISINENRDAVKPAVVLQIKDNKFKFVETIGP
jgi:branched-chain amino acid transport system substrate-binding protein